MRIVFDMSSIMWTCLSVGKDTETGFEVIDDEGQKVWVNGSPYGYEHCINSMVATLNRYNATPIDAVLVFEGLNAKARRLMINAEYKAKRGKRPMQAYDEFNNLKAKLRDVWYGMGAIAVSQDNVEGDDVIAFIAKNSRDDLVVRSNDGDMSALVGTNEHGANITVFNGEEENVNKFGMFPHKFITVYKAMVGDSSDNIKGIPRFGKESWVKFHAEFGEAGMAEMARLAELGSLQELEAEAEQNKLIKVIFDGRAEFINSWKLAKLHPEWVDTMSDALQWAPGVCLGVTSDERLKQWNAARRLVTADKWEAFVPWFLEKAAERDWLGLDIETSTPDESDEWLAAQDDPNGVDVIGSELTGMSLTFGRNMQYTVYIPVDHADTNNVTKAQVFSLLQRIQALGLRIEIQNTAFEGPVLYNEFGEDWKDNGYQGFLPNWGDTKIQASYVDENESLGLKKLSKRWLNYDQTEYKHAVTVDGVLHKMCELPATHVFDYGCDDTVVTAALHNFFRFFMELEGTYSVYREVEIDASYLHAAEFTHGVPISIARIKELEAEDDATYEENWKVFRDYLISKGWTGTVTPVYTELTAAAVKEAYTIVTGKELETKVRTPSKLIALFADDEPLLADLMTKADRGDFSGLNALIASRFTGEPIFNLGSPKQMQSLFFETMGLVPKVYNKPTPTMKARGEKTGTPKTDNLAISYALQEVSDERAAVLSAIRILKMVETRRGLYYKPYPYFVHWKTGRVHSSHNQASTVTRRASAAKPNVQQVSKNEKVEGYSPKVREVYVPHKKGAVVVSMDFKAQELRVIADHSRDENMVACFVGDNKKDMHALTGVGIFNSRNGLSWSYEAFEEALGNTDHEFYSRVKKSRALGKQTNFTTEFGAAAPKLAQTLMVTEEEAQIYIDSKEAAFPGVRVWKDGVIAEVKQKGFVTTMMGARRHLRSALLSPDRYEASKAERQAVNFKVQSSSAEMSKLAEGRMWQAKLEQRFDCELYFPVHDEIVASCAIEDLHEFIPAMHACMVGRYADMWIPIESSISFGLSFGPAHQIEIGDKPTKEAIDAGLQKVYEQMEKA